MKKIIILTALFIFAINISADNLKKQLSEQEARLDAIELSIKNLNNSINKQHKTNLRLETVDKTIISIQDSTNKNISALNERIIAIEKTQSEDRVSFKNDIQKTNTNIATNLVKMDSRTMWGGILLLCTILGFSGYLYVKRRNDSTSMSEVRKAQDALQVAQSKMLEESVKLDNQLLTIVQKQLESSALSVNKTSGELDHSLVVKLANEIARIETNLSKMDKSVRGYKQLVQAKDRMINNVRANGYEIISLLGQEYNDGMQFQTRFVPDESLPEGKRIITGMIKMQVNYNGKMIQPAEIVVSQNI